MNIVVLCGGTSTEREVSLSSGHLICEALTKNMHKVILLDVYAGIKDISKFSKEEIFTLGKQGIKDVLEKSLEEIKEKRQDKKVFLGPNVLEICKMADIVFLALHGGDGENGRLQALFDLNNILYTGSPYGASFIAMNKKISNELLKANGIRVIDGIYLKACEEIKDLQKMKYPLVVKPVSGGSSVGVSIVNNEEELLKAVEVVKKYDAEYIIQKYIKGREFSVGIVGEDVMPVIEIIPKNGFYNYQNKYVKGLTSEICPANINLDKTKEIKNLALKIFKVLNLKVYARIDFLMTDTLEIYPLEANSLPGMTPLSLLPTEAKEVGISYEMLCEKIINLSLNKEK